MIDVQLLRGELLVAIFTVHFGHFQKVEKISETTESGVPEFCIVFDRSSLLIIHYLEKAGFRRCNTLRVIHHVQTGYNSTNNQASSGPNKRISCLTVPSKI